MATTFAVLVFLLAGFSTKQVYGYYCDSDKCGTDEYCCGVNICCASYAAWQLWYFWCGIIFFMFLLSACAFFCRYRYYHTTILVHQDGTNPYARLETHPGHTFPSKTPMSDSEQYSEFPHPFGHKENYLGDYPPPTYTQSTSPAEKDPNYFR